MLYFIVLQKYNLKSSGVKDGKHHTDMGSYGSLFTVMLLDIDKGVELLIYTIKHHLLV